MMVMVSTSARSGVVGIAAAVMGGSGVAVMVGAASNLVFVLDVLDVLEVGLVGCRRRCWQEGNGRRGGARGLRLGAAGADAGAGIVLPAGLVLPLAPGLVPVLGSLLLLGSPELVMLRRLRFSGKGRLGPSRRCSCATLRLLGMGLLPGTLIQTQRGRHA